MLSGCREGVCSLEERLSAILEFGQEIQESIREEQDDQIEKTVLSWETLLKENKPLPKSGYRASDWESGRAPHYV